MELLILAGIILVIGAVFIFIAFSPGGAKSTRQMPDSSEEASADLESEEMSPAEPQPTTAHPAVAEQPAAQPVATSPAEVQQGEEIGPDVETTPTMPGADDNDEPGPLLNPLQLKAAEIVAVQIDRLQAEYIRMGEERERLAQELLTSWLVDKFEETASSLKTDVKREAQDLRQQLVRVSAEFERAQYRLTSLQNLQARLDDPRIARQIDDLVNAVKHLARVR